MKKLSAFLIEDNPLVRELIMSILDQHCPDVIVTGQAESVAEALPLVQQQAADLWLVDVELKDGTVFELLDQLAPEVLDRVGLIFITAYSTVEYTLRALRKSAIDYLVKPVDPAQLAAAVRRATERLPQHDLRQRLDDLRTLLVQEGTPLFPEKLPFVLPKGVIRYFPVADVLYLEGEDSITRVYTVSGRQFTSVRNLGFYEQALARHGHFQRISKKFLVNSQYVDRFEPEENRVVLTNGQAISASRRGSRNLGEFFRSLWR
jgi:two-component system LytT family response regulator